MTTQEDWAWRAQHLREAATRLEIQAQGLKDMAADFRTRAERCERRAHEPEEVSPAVMDSIEREAMRLQRG